MIDPDTLFLEINIRNRQITKLWYAQACMDCMEQDKDAFIIPAKMFVLLNFSAIWNASLRPPLIVRMELYPRPSTCCNLISHAFASDSLTLCFLCISFVSPFFTHGYSVSFLRKRPELQISAALSKCGVFFQFHTISHEKAISFFSACKMSLPDLILICFCFRSSKQYVRYHDIMLMCGKEATINTRLR